MKEKFELQKYNLSYLIKYTAAAFFYPFFGLYLSSTGKSVTEIGFILMIIPLVAVFSNPTWNYFAKNINHNKWFLVVFSFIEAIVIFLLLIFLNIYVVVLLAILLSVVSQPFYSILEGYTTVYTIQTKKNYSKIRLFGSAGYAIGVLISGFLISFTGYKTILISSSVLLVLLGFILFSLSPLELNKSEDKKGSIKELFKNKNFVLFLLFYIVTMATLFGGEGYWGLYFESRGIDEKTFGWVSFLAYGLEALFLIVLAKYGKKIKINVLMISIAVINSLRFLVFALNLPFYMLVFNSVLRAYVMSTFLYVIVRYLSKYVKRYNITLALIIADTSKNIFQAIITQTGSIIIDNYSYNVFFYVLTGISVLALFFIKYNQDSNHYAIISKEID